MKYKLQDLIDIEQFQSLQERLNEIYRFPSAIIDNEGNILTATAWQDVCTKFHRANKECERECIKSDQYIQSHLHEANPAVSYRCPFGLVDNATPIIIEGVHYGNFFTGQFFLEKPDLEFFRGQAKTYGFDENDYIEAVKKVPIWTQEQVNSYLLFIKGLIAIISESGLKKLREIETRKRVEESEERANTILRQMLDGFWILDAKSAHILDGNEAICRMLGYSRDELLQISAIDVEASESRELAACRMQGVIQSGSANYETRYRRKDGAILDVDVSVTYLATRSIFFGFHRDITERKRVEAEMKRSDDALKRQNELFSSLLKLLPMGVFMVEAPSGKPLLANDAACTLLGRGILPDASSRNLSEVYQARKLGSRDPYPLDEMPILLGMRGEKSHVDDMMVERPDGTQTLLEVFGSPVTDEQGRIWASLVSFIDITARKRAEEALKKSRDEFQGYFEMGSMGICITSPEKGWLAVNERLCQMLGYSKAELLGLSWADLTHPDDLGADLQLFEEVRAGKRERYELDKRFICKDGSVVFTTLSVACQRNADGTVNHFLASLLDVTARKQAEAALQSSLREKEALLKEVHHRVKNNLQVVTSLLRMEARRSEHPATKSVLNEMKSRILSMALLHESLYRSGTFATVDLGAYLKDLANQSFRALVTRSGSIRLHLELASIQVEMDQALPCGLLVNELISNCLKHGFPGDHNGEVRVELQLLDGGPQLRLRVSDTGVGLPADFESKRGKSLGLQLVSNLARQIDGRLEVGSGPGAVFDVIFTPKHSKPNVSNPPP